MHKETKWTKMYEELKYDQGNLYKQNGEEGNYIQAEIQGYFGDHVIDPKLVKCLSSTYNMDLGDVQKVTKSETRMTASILKQDPNT